MHVGRAPGKTKPVCTMCARTYPLQWRPSCPCMTRTNVVTIRHVAAGWQQLPNAIHTPTTMGSGIPRNIKALRDAFCAWQFQQEPGAPAHLWPVQDELQEGMRMAPYVVGVAG